MSAVTGGVKHGISHREMLVTERELFSAAIVAAAASYVSVHAIRHWVQRRSILDVPNERSSHTVPTPRGGGLAIVLVTLLGLSVLQLVRPVMSHAAWLMLTIGGLIIAAVSWLDDLRSVPSLIRFAVHIAAAVAFVAVTGGWSEVWLPGVGVIALGKIGAVIAVIWIAGLTNAYNFMDGLDGIAGLQAVVAGLGWLIVSTITHSYAVGVIGALLAGSAAGFLLHNWRPARIFMGDVGSAFLGYMFAAAAVIGADSDPRLAFVGVLLVWPFVMDTSLTFAGRALRRERVFSAHKSHLYQRLQQSGWSHANVSALYGALAAAGVICAAWILKQPWR